MPNETAAAAGHRSHRRRSAGAARCLAALTCSLAVALMAGCQQLHPECIRARRDASMRQWYDLYAGKERQRLDKLDRTAQLIGRRFSEDPAEACRTAVKIFELDCSPFADCTPFE